MRILGIDASSTAIGLAVIHFRDGKPHLYDSASLTAKDLGACSPDERFVRLREWVFGRIESVYKQGCDAAVIERPQTRHPTPNMFETVGMVRGGICGPYDWSVLPMMHPKTARKLLGIGGNASKAQTAEHVRQLLGDSAAGLDEHAIDAAAVAIAAWHQLQQEGVV